MKIVWSARTNELVTLAQAKAHLRVDHTADDTYIQSLIDAAVDMVEVEANRVLAVRGGSVYLDAWPVATPNNPKAALIVPAMPLRQAIELQYKDTNDVWWTIDDGIFVVDLYSMPGKLVLKSGESWPSQLSEDPNCIILEFTAGETIPPKNAVHAVKALVAHWYENREAVTVGTSATSTPLGYERLLATFSYPLCCPAEQLPVGGA